MSDKIIFKKVELTSTFLDPRQQFEPMVEEFHVRFDPITGRMGTSHILEPSSRKNWI